MTKPTKNQITKQVPTKPVWWDANLCTSLDNYVPTARMLVTHAIASGATVFTGNCRGVLEDDGEEGAVQMFLKALSDKVGASAIFASGPIFGRGAYETWLLWAEGTIVVKVGTDNKITVSLATINQAQYVALGETIGRYLLPENVRSPVYSLADGPNGIEIAEVGSASKPWEEENYSEEVVEDFKFARAELEREEPLGRLLLIDGEPGTGKTFFIRGLMEIVYDAIFVLVPSHMVENLSGPELVPMLIRARGLAGSDKPIILVIEDADKALVPRNDQEGSLTAISALLNVSDGILGHTLNLRIVCTTNAKIEEIDPALKRPGRLSRQIHVGLLDAKKASEVYYRLTGTEGVQFEGPMPLAEVYRFAKAEEIADSEDETDESEEEEEDDDVDWDDDEDED